MPPADLSAWQRVGPMLAARRVKISPRYANRRAFAADTGLNWRTIHDAEHAKRANFKSETIGAFESAYQLVPGSLGRALAGGDLEPARDDGPRLVPVPDPSPGLDLTVASDALINAFIEAQREDTEEEREFKEILRGTWRLHTVAHADKAAVLNALDALLHTGVPRRILAEREAQRQARETS